MLLPSSNIAILGAGISGLTVGWKLKKKFPNLTLFEKSSRAGGWIKTSFNHGSLFECGPRSFRLEGANDTLDLIHEMGLSEDLIQTSSDAKKRYILENGKLKPVSTALYPLMWSAFRDLFVSKCKDDDESVYDFFSRRFSTAVADRLIDPLIKGIYAGDPKTLSVRACFPNLWNMEQESRSLMLGMLKKSFKNRATKGIVTLRKGLESLVFRLTDKLHQEIRLESKVDRMEFKEGKVQIYADGKMHLFDHVISTLPANELAQLLPKSALSELLLEIPFASVGIVHLGYSKAVNPYKGFGYLVPSREKEDILGVVFDSSAFPEQNRFKEETRLTVMIGGVHSEDELKAIALDSTRRHLGIHEFPDIIDSLTAHSAIAQYPVGFPVLLKKIARAKEEFPQISLLGTSFYGVSVNQAIASSAEFSNHLMGSFVDV